MSTIKPFKALRPKKELANKVAELPYDVINSEEARIIAKDNPYSFLHVSKSEIDLDPNIDLYDKKVYEKSRDNLQKLISDGILFQENKPCLYIYKQRLDNWEQYGIVGCASVQEYLDDVIKKHELTRADKEQDRTNHVDYCNANTGLVFLTYKAVDKIDKIVAEWIKKPAEYDFVSSDLIEHAVWVIDDEKTISNIVAEFGKIPVLYVADGHHRSASAARVGKQRKDANPNHKGDEEYNGFLAAYFPHNQLHILDYNRVIKDLNNYNPKEFISKISEKFSVEEMNHSEPYKPTKQHEFGMYLENKWYKIVAKPTSFNPTDPVESLDVSILQKNLIAPILNIVDPRRDKRIDFVGGIRGLKELEKRVNSGEMKVAFSMFPTTIEDLMRIADAGKIMPPKSTWFEPKLRSGLLVHLLS